MANQVQQGVNNYSTATSITLGYDVASGNIVPPSDLLVSSASAGSTITLPVITMAQNGTSLGFGTNQLRILNLAAQPITLAAPSGATIYGSSATLAQNVACVLESDTANNRWYRLN